MVDGLEKRGSEEALRDKYKEPIISGGKKKKGRNQGLMELQNGYWKSRDQPTDKILELAKSSLGKKNNHSIRSGLEKQG